MISVCLKKLQSAFLLISILIISALSFPHFSHLVYAASNSTMNMQNTQSMNMNNNNEMNTMDMSDMTLPPPKWAVDIGKFGGEFKIFEINNPIYTIIIPFVDLISVIIVVISLYKILTSIKEFGKSTLGAAQIYLLNGIIVQGSVITIYSLTDANIYNIHDVTVMTLWHIMFSYSVILFFASSIILKSLANVNSSKSSYKNAIYYLYFSTILCISVIIAAPYTDNFFVKYVQPTTFSQDGYFHIFAFIMSVISVIYLHQIRKKYTVIRSVTSHLYIVLASLALIHLWELLIESWKWIILSADIIQLCDRMLWIPVFISMFQIHTKLKNPTTTVEPKFAAEALGSQIPSSDQVHQPSIPEIPSASPQESKQGETPAPQTTQIDQSQTPSLLSPQESKPEDPDTKSV